MIRISLTHEYARSLAEYVKQSRYSDHITTSDQMDALAALRDAIALEVDLPMDDDAYQQAVDVPATHFPTPDELRNWLAS